MCRGYPQRSCYRRASGPRDRLGMSGVDPKLSFATTAARSTGLKGGNSISTARNARNNRATIHSSPFDAPRRCVNVIDQTELAIYMFDITPDDIAHLSDEQLRTLIGLLCEAELRRLGYSRAAVTWGGNQNAADGGLDVRVNLPSDKIISGFIPRNATGFQVKKQDMPRMEILKEMRPKGVLRSEIQGLADRKGAYIIASSRGSTANIALNQRRTAMMEATKDLPERGPNGFRFLRSHPVSLVGTGPCGSHRLGSPLYWQSDLGMAAIWRLGLSSGRHRRRLPD